MMMHWLLAFALLGNVVLAQDDADNEPDLTMDFPPPPPAEVEPTWSDTLVCSGTCLPPADCLASGRVYELGSCGSDNEETVCCKEAPSCYMETFDGAVNGTCRGLDYCAKNGGHSFESITCGTRGDFACCSSDASASSSTEAVGSSALTPCQVAGLLRAAGFEGADVARMVCTAKHESGYRCNAIGRTNRDGTQDFGLFQVNSRYWCGGGPRSPANGGDCGISCSEALDCTKAATCARRIFTRQGIRAWYGYTSFKSECDAYRLPAECANGGGGAPIQPQAPTPAPVINGGQAIGTPCTFEGRSGKCNDNTACARAGGTVKAARLGARGCEKIPSNQIMCCLPATSQPPVNAPACSMGANRGLCLPLTQCGGDKKSIPASQGAVGCGHIKDWNIQCCVVPPRTGSVASLAPPAGRSCALARPSGCSSFTGRQLTVNIQFADEMIRVNSHARNAGIKVTVTDSYRVPNVNYGASRSRHKVGFALDMNANGCNSDCMCYINSVPNAGAKRFLQALMADSNLHWGADPRNPINWAVGGCAKDSVHVQSREYQAGSNYDSVQRCLAGEWNAGRFSTFNCASGASLLNDDVEANEDDIDTPTSDSSTGLDAGAIVGITIVVVAIVVAAVVGVALYMRKRAAASADNAVTGTPMSSPAPASSSSSSSTRASTPSSSSSARAGASPSFV